MAARPRWKVLTVGAAIAGFGITGAGIAMADGEGDASGVKPIEVTSAQSASDSAAPSAGDNADHRDPGKAAQPDNDSPDSDSPDNTPDDNSPDNDSPDNTPDDDSPDNDSPDDA